MAAFRGILAILISCSILAAPNARAGNITGPKAASPSPITPVGTFSVDVGPNPGSQNYSQTIVVGASPGVDHDISLPKTLAIDTEQPRPLPLSPADLQPSLSEATHSLMVDSDEKKAPTAKEGDHAAQAPQGKPDDILVSPMAGFSAETREHLSGASHNATAIVSDPSTDNAALHSDAAKIFEQPGAPHPAAEEGMDLDHALELFRQVGERQGVIHWHQTMAETARRFVGAAEAVPFYTRGGLETTAATVSLRTLREQLPRLALPAVEGPDARGLHRNSDAAVILAIPRSWGDPNNRGRFSSSDVNDALAEMIINGEVVGDFQVPNEFIVGFWSGGRFIPNPRFGTGRARPLKP